MCVTKEEFDSSPIAWEIYKLMYAANFNKTFELSYKSRKYIIYWRDYCGIYYQIKRINEESYRV